MCICKPHPQVRRRVPSMSSKMKDTADRRMGKADRRSAHIVSGSPRLSSALTVLVGVALACLAGGGDARPRRQASGFGIGNYDAIGLLRSVRRYLTSIDEEDSSDASSLLAQEQVESYLRDGFVVVSGLLEDVEMSSLVEAGEGLISKHVAKAGGTLSKGNFQVHEFGLLFNDERFRDVALQSRLPVAAAELLQLDRETQNLRVLKDVFLAKGHESTSSCGWHVDDQLFWPAAYKLPSSDIDQSGLNAWIAIDDMPIENGGSMAVSPQSHASDFSWRAEAFDALNFNEQFGNGVSKDELFDLVKMGRVDTCGLEKVAPAVYDDIEMSKQEFSFKRGDVIFMNRWLFHKSTDFTEKGKLALQAVHDSFGGDRGEPPMLKRYSLRYVAGNTSLPGGFMTELSVLASDGFNSGKKLNEVRGDWYPTVWPEVDADVHERIEDLNKNEMPVAQEKFGAIMAEVMGLFAKR
ncbi:hypothetical protein ACHAXT_010241 [Thalassiosira profunda]